MKAFWVGLPGWMKASFTLLLVGPLVESAAGELRAHCQMTMESGYPRLFSNSRSSTRTTRTPLSEPSTSIAETLARELIEDVQRSGTSCPSASWSLMKSIDHRSFGRARRLDGLASESERPSSASLRRNRQSFLGIQPIHALVVDEEGPLCWSKGRRAHDSPTEVVSSARASRRCRHDATTIASTRLVAHRRAMHTDALCKRDTD